MKVRRAESLIDLVDRSLVIARSAATKQSMACANGWIASLRSQ
jgi:hypothetical protein